MEPVEVNYEFDGSRQLVVRPPVNEALRDPWQAAQIWPLEYGAGGSLAEQVGQHAVGAECVTEVIDRLSDPTMTVQAALETGSITEEQAGRFYDTLSETLADEDHKRLALYLPLEYIPEASWAPEDSFLWQSVEKFKATYLSAWHSLLNVQDVRANFVDGDVLEEEHRASDLARVVKAAHLVPLLIERGLLSEADAAELHEAAGNSTLKQNLAEGLAAYWGDPSEKRYAAVPNASGHIPFAITERRRAWLEQQSHENHIQNASYDAALAILDGKLPPELVDEALSNKADDQAGHILVEAAYKAVSSAGDSDRAALYDRVEGLLEALWESDDPALVSRLTSVYRRFYHMGLIDDSLIAERDISLPNLEGPWSENLPLLYEATDDLKRVASEVESDPELNELVYPIFLVGGSRVKGYGESDSDIDIGVLVRPGVPEEERSRIRRLLESTIGPDRNYEVTEFWLDQAEDGQLRVHDFDTPDRHTGDSYSTHVLFGAAWVGDEETISNLQRSLPGPYFNGSDDPDSQSVRRLYLEKLEQDALQYRLMHKGYARHYPLVKRPEWTNHQAVDGDSVFWDSGYRQIATKLFINTVFLPKL